MSKNYDVIDIKPTVVDDRLFSDTPNAIGTSWDGISIGLLLALTYG